jgi:hypothetical protein
MDSALAPNSALGRTFISTAFYERLLRVENVYPLAVLFLWRQSAFFRQRRCQSFKFPAYPRRQQPVSRKNLLEEILHGDPGASIGLLVVGGRRRVVSGMSQLVKVCSALP